MVVKVGNQKISIEVSEKEAISISSILFESAQNRLMEKFGKLTEDGVFVEFVIRRPGAFLCEKEDESCQSQSTASNIAQSQNG